MRQAYITLLILLLITNWLKAQTDTMYVMKLGDVIGKYNIHTQIDSLLFHKPTIPNDANHIAIVQIPAGSFTMGSPESETAREVEESQHLVNLNAFAMSKYEITNEQYATFLNAKGIKSSGKYSAGLYPTQPLIFTNSTMGLIFDGTKWISVAGYEKHPAICITWYGANEFAIYARGTLPTEAQWEYACRAGSISPFSTGNCLSNTDANYNWSYPYDTCNNTKSTSPGKTQAVGILSPNAFGLHDMHGNVLEWCADWYGTYPSATQANPLGPVTGSQRVYRGGAWTSSARSCRSAYRGKQSPDFYNQAVGFRIVLPASPTVEKYDTMYVMEAGLPIAKYNIHNQLDSIIFYKSNQLSHSRFPKYLETNDKISIFVKALKLTHLNDSLTKIKDESYKPKALVDQGLIIPAERKYGYTALIEDDLVLKANGINTIEDLIIKAKEIYPLGTNYDFTDRRNSLNQYISYHLIEKKITTDKFHYAKNAIPGFTPDEFLETMYSNRIIRVSKTGNQTILNANSVNAVNVRDSDSQACLNGAYHLLDNMLVYSNDVEQMLQNTRIRFDVASLFPEMTNNQIRASEDQDKDEFYDSFKFEPGYLSNIQMNEGTSLKYYSEKEKIWCDYQSDSFTASGNFDITLRLLPIPPGTYELRYSYKYISTGGITQIFVDDEPIGLPTNLNISPLNPKIGWIADKNTLDNGLANDSLMRENGYLKSPNTYEIYWKNARDDYNTCRKIIGVFTFSDYKPHTIRFQSTENTSKNLFLDYFEFVPQSIYNPSNGSPESRE